MEHSVNVLVLPSWKPLAFVACVAMVCYTVMKIQKEKK